MKPTHPCADCGGDTVAWARGGSRQFCSERCRLTFNARAKAQGAVIVILAKVWRRNYGRGETATAAFREMVRILDTFNADDRASGRPDPTDHIARQLATGLRYGDPARTRKDPSNA